jgi:hypothetical protein
MVSVHPFASWISARDQVVTTKEPPAETADAPALAKRQLTPEARRALAEAEVRRRARDAEGHEQPAEKGGRAGPDPVRYGDWEKGGIISDF